MIRCTFAGHRDVCGVQADYVIAMVERKEGGAYATLQYAKKKQKRIINLAERKK